METNVINVGNSKGIIIPAKFLKILNLKDKVQLNLSDNKIIIEPVTRLPREGWEARIKADIEKNGIPEMELPDVFEDENTDEWQW
jgi:antitoxin MazE